MVVSAKGCLYVVLHELRLKPSESLSSISCVEQWKLVGMLHGGLLTANNVAHVAALTQLQSGNDLCL